MSKTASISADDVDEGLVLATSIPQWLRALAFAWAVFVLYGAKYYAAYGEDQNFVRQIEQLPPMLNVAVMIIISSAPLAIVQYGSRRWLRKYYPEVVALRWSKKGITLSDDRSVPWAEVKKIRDCSQIRNPRIEIHTDLFGIDGKICLPTPLLLNPEQAYRDLHATLEEYRKEVNALKREVDTHRRKDVRSDPVVRAQVQKWVIEALGKTTSQLKAEGIPTTDEWAIRSHFWNKAAERKDAELDRKYSQI